MRVAPAAIFAVMLVLASTLGGCEAVDEAMKSLSNGGADRQGEATTEVVKIDPPQDAARVENYETASRPPLKLTPRMPPDRYDPRSLVGKDRDQLLRILGAPDEIREAPPATVWNYVSENCALDLFLYMDIASREFHALAYEVKKGESPEKKIAAERCVGQIYAANKAKLQIRRTAQ